MPSSYPDAPAEAEPLPDENLPPEAYAPGYEPQAVRDATAPPAPPPPPGPAHGLAGEPAEDETVHRRGAGEMGFFEHLEELRHTILKSVAALIVSMMVVAVFFPWMFDFLRYPLVRALGRDKAAAVLNTLTPFGVYGVLLTVILCGGLALALPFIGYFVAQFVAPGLTPRERGMLRPVLGAGFGLFVAGGALAYFALLPAGLDISHWLNEQLGFTMHWNASDYFSLVAWMVFGTGLVFEFPLVLVALMALGIVEADTLTAYRRHAVVVILVVAAVVTPSQDLFTLFMMAGPMYALFEASLVIGRRLARRREEELERDPAG